MRCGEGHKFLAPATDSQGMYADEYHYTIRRQNAHVTGDWRKLLYPWHPWTGQQVHIHEVIDKNDSAVFRCSLSGQLSDRWLEFQPGCSIGS